jgi:hypothetical protein
VSKFAEEANSLYEALMQAQATAKDFNNRDKVFGFPATEYTQLDQMEEDFEPCKFSRLYSLQCSQCCQYVGTDVRLPLLPPHLLTIISVQSTNYGICLLTST